MRELYGSITAQLYLSLVRSKPAPV
jgi:hypothetical protein